MTVTVAETGDRHRALVTHDGKAAWCCEGHAEAAEAARHAWKLTRAIARREAGRATS